MNNRLTKHHLIILAANALMVVIFAFVFLADKNSEFIYYLILILAMISLVFYSMKKIKYTYGLLWWLSLWGSMHFAGGGISLKGQRLYDLILIPITNDVFRYDQLVHIIGFGACTLLMYQIIRASLNYPIKDWFGVGVVVVMAGLGIGAVNEIIEFIAAASLPNTNNGGYLNTSLDLVADLIGGLLFFTYIYFKNRGAKIT